MSFRSPEETYEEFFLWFNSENAEGWANVMQYPHVRISSGVNSSYLSTSGLSYFETKNDYANAVSWKDFKASGTATQVKACIATLSPGNIFKPNRSRDNATLPLI